MNSNILSPLVAVNVILLRRNQMLFVLRKTNPLTWSIPGGHMLFGETIEECARREVLEETGLEVADLRVCGAINEINRLDWTHYINFFVVARNNEGKELNGEPEDIQEIRWYSVHEVPQPLFYNVKSLTQIISFAKIINSECMFIQDFRHHLSLSD